MSTRASVMSNVPEVSHYNNSATSVSARASASDVSRQSVEDAVRYANAVIAEEREREEAAVAAVAGGGDGVKGRMVEDGATRSLLSWVAAGVEVRESGM